jgi:hypothetical protein
MAVFNLTELETNLFPTDTLIDSLEEVDSIIGTETNDTITGSSGDEVSGNGGADNLSADGVGVTLSGGLGSDT